MTDYPAYLSIRPLTSWVGELTKPLERRRSPFRAPWGATAAQFRTEVAALDAVDYVVEVAIPEEQFRIDAWPRAMAILVAPSPRRGG